MTGAHFKTLLTGFLALLLASCSDKKIVPDGDARWLQKAQQPDVPSINKKAYEQIARLRICQLGRWQNPGGFDILSIWVGSDSPTTALYNMGFDVLPALVEALDDITPTTVVEPPRHQGSFHKTWKVNELAARLIVRIAEHEFVLGQSPNTRVMSWDLEKDPSLIPQFKKLVLSWHGENRNRTLEERKIADTRDDWFRNRLDAVEWLGKNKVVKAAPSIVEYINKTFATKKESSLTDTELAECSLALGQIGDATSLPLVRRVCQYLQDRLRRHGVTGSMDLHTLFQAHQGLALLGDKAKVLHELKTLCDEPSVRMEPSSRKEYETRLARAAQW